MFFKIMSCLLLSIAFPTCVFYYILLLRDIKETFAYKTFEKVWPKNKKELFLAFIPFNLFFKSLILFYIDVIIGIKENLNDFEKGNKE